MYTPHPTPFIYLFHNRKKQIYSNTKKYSAIDTCISFHCTNLLCASSIGALD